MQLLRVLVIFVFFVSAHSGYSQENKNIDILANENQWFISIGYGVQISGIKKEDFIISNISPSLLASVGLWVTPKLAFQLGYKGYYFNYIGDQEKHYYSYLFGEILLNLNEFINSQKLFNGNWKLIIHPGIGYFYNNYYNRPNICGNVGLLNSLAVSKRLAVFLDISAIFGWDIYQGDDDILPSCLLGITYSL